MKSLIFDLQNTPFDYEKFETKQIDLGWPVNTTNINNTIFVVTNVLESARL